MNYHEFIALGNQEPPLRFLVIGGYAVGAHGYGRYTNDFDIMVRRADAEKWIDRARTSGLVQFARNDTFAQFTQDDDGGLDLMFVAEETFEKLWNSAIRHSFKGSEARVPSLDHLLALKLHALKHTLPHRTAKDMEDLEMLARINDLPIKADHYEQLFLKYGNKHIYETLQRILRRS